MGKEEKQQAWQEAKLSVEDSKKLMNFVEKNRPKMKVSETQDTVIIDIDEIELEVVEPKKNSPTKSRRKNKK